MDKKKNLSKQMHFTAFTPTSFMCLNIEITNERAMNR